MSLKWYWNLKILKTIFFMLESSGLSYNHVMIVNDDSSIISKWSFKIIYDPESSFMIVIGL